ncbi:cell wall-active antibiotics response protein [bacterium]|nr:cell wall-active antibiotics response protein [bacterium]
MKRALVLLLSGLLVISVMSIAIAKDREPRIENYSESAPLDGVKSAEVTVELGLAEFTLKAGDPKTLAQFDAIYDARYTQPDFKYERDGDRAFVLIETKDVKKWKRKEEDRQEAEYRVYLSPEPELDIKCEVGLGDNELDLTGLKVNRVDLESGLAETDIIVAKPNSIRTRVIKIESGLGELNTDHLGNLRFDRLSLEGGLGSSDLDLRGFEGEGEVVISVGMGDCTLILPESVGVRLIHEESFMSSVDTRGFTKVGGDRYESQGYDSKESHLLIELEVGMGTVDIEWRN